MDLFSMTGFATASQNTGKYTLSVQLRAVNHRFLDVSIRTPEPLRGIEPLLRERITARIKRGKIDCLVQCQEREDVMEEPKIQISRVQAMLDAEKQILALSPNAKPLSVADILCQKGVLATVSEDAEVEALSEATMAMFERAWAEFTQSRAREGAKLAAILSACCARILSLAAECKPRLPSVYAAYKEKLVTWAKEAGGATLDEARLVQEVALYATKIDIVEEVDRLEAHVAEVLRVIAPEAAVVPRAAAENTVAAHTQTPLHTPSTAGSHGKRLDFLAQELHREANTLGSKSTDLALSKIALDLKVVIEQMREQVQNIE